MDKEKAEQEALANKMREEMEEKMRALQAEVEAKKNDEDAQKEA